MRPLLLIFLLAFFHACQTQEELIPPEKSPEQKIQSLAAHYETLNRFQGQIVVAHQDSIYANFASKGLESTRFPLGQLSESILATLALELVSSNQLNLDEPISKALPDCRNCRGISYQHLLFHDSHFETIDSIQLRFPVEQYGPIKFANLSKKIKTPAWTDLNYNLLIKSLERKYQYEIGTLLKRNLKEPFSTSAKRFPRFHQVFDKDSQQIILKTKNITLNTTPAYQYGMTAIELAKFYQSTLLQGGLDSTSISFFKKIKKGHAQLGFYIGHFENNTYLQNASQSSSRHQTQVLINLDEKQIIIVSNFVDKAGVSAEMTAAIHNIMKGKKLDLPPSRTNTTALLASANKHEGNYEQDGFILSILQKDSSLVARWKGGQELLIPKDSNYYYFQKKDLSIQFLNDENKAIFYPGLLQGDTLTKRPQ